jgi:hypothetical protein
MISDKDEKAEVKHKSIASYFADKVLKYKQQDLKANRFTTQTTETFVNVQWLENCINKCCGGCGCNLSIDVDDNFKVESDITAQRLDNSLPHYINNIIPMCINCNCSNK